MTAHTQHVDLPFQQAPGGDNPAQIVVRLMRGDIPWASSVPLTVAAAQHVVTVLTEAIRAAECEQAEADRLVWRQQHPEVA